MKKKKTLVSYLWQLAFVALALFLTLHFAVDYDDLQQLPDIIREADDKFLIIGMGTMLVFFLVQAWAEKKLLETLGYHSSLAACYRYSLTDYYFSIITPGAAGGQPSEIYAMKKDGIDVGSSSLVMMVYNGIYHLAVVIVVFAAGFGRIHHILSASPLYRTLFIIGIGIQSLLVLMVGLLAFQPRIFAWITGKLLGLIRHFSQRKADQWQAAFDHTRQEFARGSQWLKKNPSILLKMIPLLVLYLSLYYSVGYWVALAFGVRNFSLLDMISFQSVYTMTFESLPLPSGIGLAEVGFLSIFSPVYPEAVLPVAMIMTRTITHYSFLLIGGAAAIYTSGKGKEADQDPSRSGSF